MSMREVVPGKARKERLERLAERRANRVMVPPAFIFAYVEEFPNADPILFRYMFPVSGKITRGLVYVESINSRDKAIKLRAGLVNRAGGQHSDFVVHEGYTVIKQTISVAAGTRLALSFVTEKENLVVRGIWIGFAFTTSGVLALDEPVEPLEITENA